MSDWQMKLLAAILSAGLVSWAGWASFTLAAQSRDIAYIQGTVRQIEKRMEGK